VGGVILPDADRRQSNLKEVTGLCRETGTRSGIIPLFDDLEELSRVADYYEPDFLHLCDALVPRGGNGLDVEAAVSIQSGLKERFPELGVMRTLPVPTAGADADVPVLEIAERLEPVSDFFLTDTWVPQAPVSGFVGITGEPCDWAVARELVRRSRIPVILAGGLSPENVYEGLLRVAPAGADSCTQTNMRDGDGTPIRFKKDFLRVRRFVEEVRRAESSLTGGGEATG
jgi:phosphoribosylanthranilate isomerase